MRTEIKLVTPELAKKYLQRNHSNRPFSETKCAKYVIQMNKNLWMLTGQGISIDTNGNLLDGQHRLNAIVKTGKSFPMLFIFDVATETFEVYDSGSNRSLSDAFSISGITDPNNVSGMVFNYMLFAIGEYPGSKGGFANNGITKHECIQKYHEHPDFWKAVHTETTMLARKLRLVSIIHTGAFMAHLVLDRKKKFEDVISFFRQIFSVEPDKYSCTTHFRNYVLRDALAVRKTPAHVKMILLAKTWNYWVRQKDIRTLTCSPDEKFPSIL